MNRKKNNDAHERARGLIVLADPEAFSAADRLSERLSGEPSSNAVAGSAPRKLCLMPRLCRKRRGGNSSLARSPRRRRAQPGLDHAEQSAPPRPGIAAPSRTHVDGCGQLAQP